MTADEFNVLLAPSTASAARTHGVSGLFRRIRLDIRMHHLLFIVFTVITAVPITVLAVWENRTSYKLELESVRERHMLVAPAGKMFA